LWLKGIFKVKNRRPVYLDVTKYKFPNTAIVSILHRISGVILFLYVPFLLWSLDKSLSSGEHFQEFINSFDKVVMKLSMLIFFAALIFHLVAGIRHLIMDMGIGETKRGGRLGANIVFIISALLIIMAGIWLW
jgi:succinate dehydrogenase / fumarate reductase, cytochrome b subunit